MSGATVDPAVAPGAGTRVLRPSKLKYALLAVFGAVLAIFGIGLGAADFWYGWLLLGLGLVVAASCLMMLSARFASLTLDAEGFTLRAGFTRKRWRWDAVGDFYPTIVDRNRAVAFQYLDQSALSGFKNQLGEMRGFDEYLPETYRMDVDELAALLNEWRVEATASVPPPGETSAGESP